MYKILIGCLLTSCSCFFAAAQQDSLAKATAKAQGDSMAATLIRKDFTRYFTYAHPLWVRQNGGAIKFKKQLSAEVSSMEKQGSYFNNASVSMPKEIFDTAGQQQCIVVQSLSVNSKDGTTITVKSAQVAVSFNKGKKWFFIDAGGKDIATLRKTYPQLSSRLVIPQTKESTTSAQ
jgi:hypothetical protein